MAPSNLVYRITDRTTHRNLVSNHEPIPSVRDHEVLVEVRGVTLNSRDVQICGGLYPSSGLKDNLVPCSDGAGVVAAAGEAVSDVKVGDRVIVNFALDHLYGTLKSQDHALGGGVDGMLRQFAVVPAQAVVKIPDECKLDFVQMASLVCTGATAWNALFGSTPLRPGQVVLFQGTGGVSVMGIQIAKAAGAVTIVTSSSDEKLQFIQEKFGVDHVINYRKTPDWAEEALRLTNGQGVDYILEIGGAGTMAQSVKAIAPGGMIAVIGYLADIKQEDMPNISLLALLKGCTVRGILVGSHQLTSELVRFVARKNFQPYIHKTLGFTRDEVVAAFDLLESGRHIGKVGIVVAEN